MIKRSITYTNPFTDEQTVEDHWFHISKADLVEMELEEHSATYRSKEGDELTGMRAKLQRIVDAEDGRAIMAEVKDIVRRSYGRKEGNRFLKSPSIWEDFAASEAFSQLFFELCTNAEKSAEFMNGIIPNNLDQIAREVAEQAEGEAAKSASATLQAGSDSPETLGESNSKSAAERSLNDARKRVIQEATADHPIYLSEADVSLLTHQELKTGLADGRYKLT